MSAPTLLALMPCGLRNPFKETLYKKFPQYVDDSGESESLIIEGNLNYEKSFYGNIDTMTNIDSLPDILITSDINSLHHKRFLDRFLNEENFEVIGAEINESYTEAGYSHPGGLFTMLPANVLVIVADIRKFNNAPLPRTWSDLLSPRLERSLIIRGDKDFFCNAVFFPYVRDYGFESLSHLARNTAAGLHPSQMVKMINSDNTDGITAFVMPYSFYKNVRKRENFRLIWPEDGAIVSPVQMLVKKGAYSRHKDLIDFIISNEMKDMLLSLSFPTQESGKIPPLNWLGWDNIYSMDTKECKALMQEKFFESFKGEYVAR